MTDSGDQAIYRVIEMMGQCQYAALALVVEERLSLTTPEMADAMNAVEILVNGEYGTTTANDLNNLMNVAKGHRKGTGATRLLGEMLMFRKKYNNDGEGKIAPIPEFALHDFFMATAGPYQEIPSGYEHDEFLAASPKERFEAEGVDFDKGLDGLAEQHQPQTEAMAERLAETGFMYSQAAMYYRYLIDEWEDDEAEARGRIKRVLEWRDKRIEARLNPSRKNRGR